MILKNRGPIKYEYILHLLLWGGVLLFPHIKFIERDGGYPETFGHDLNSILFIIIPSYVFYFWWLPLTSPQRWKWLPILVLSFVGAIFVHEFTDSLFHDNSFQPFSWKSFLSDMVKTSAFFLVFLALYFIKHAVKQKDELAKVTKDKNQAELRVFEAQAATQAADEVHYIYADKTTYKINSREILFIKAAIDYVKIVTSNREIMVLDSIRRWKQVLSKQGFLQAHRSYLVRLDAIVSISQGKLKLKKHDIPIGPSYKSALMDAFKTK